MYLVKTPKLVQKMYPDLVWNLGKEEKKIYLTFDDGPIPEATPWVLDILSKYNALATFFCVGENAAEHPELVHKIIQQGHSIGSHTYSHVSGWMTHDDTYYKEVHKAAHLLSTSLFRPPYGRIKPRQSKVLSKDYKIIMWDLLSGDFDPAISAEQCYNNVANNVKNGSIIVFHDSVKSIEKLKEFLPDLLHNLQKEGFKMNNIHQDLLVPTYN
jgi:peptidoglycan/xylan/chitin deacetylase (PgdA/CDA1 family)